jgi:O-antigen/teichoic acid export membrane protein
MRFSLPVGAMAMTDMLLLWLDTLFVGAFRSAADVATYGVVARLVSMTIAVQLVAQSFAPFVPHLVARRNFEGLQDLLHTATRWCVLVTAPIIAILMVAGGDILTLLRQSAGSGWPALVLLGGAYLVAAATGPTGQVLTMSGHSMLSLINSSAALIANVVLDILLIPRFGVVGAAAAWAVAMILVNVVRALQVWRLHSVSPISRLLLKPIGASIVAGAVAAGLRLVLIRIMGGTFLRVGLVTAAFVLAYLFAIKLFGLEEEDRFLIRALLRGLPPASPPGGGP